MKRDDILVLEGFGVAFGPLAAGYSYDAGGSYYGALVLYLVLFGVAIFSLALLRRPKMR